MAHALGMEVAPRPRRLRGRSARRASASRFTDAGALGRFKASAAYRTILSFVTGLSDAAAGQRIGAAREVSAPARAMLDGLEQMSGWVDEIPPVQQAMRYGNAAYRCDALPRTRDISPLTPRRSRLPTPLSHVSIPPRIGRAWHARLEERAVGIVRAVLEAAPLAVLPPSREAAAAELAAYLRDAFGNTTRIDYGTGHELSFLLVGPHPHPHPHPHPRLHPRPCETTMCNHRCCTASRRVERSRPPTGRCWCSTSSRPTCC